MDSGSKQYDKQVSDKRIDGSKYENFEMLQRAEVGSRHDIDLRLEDFSIGSIVKADHDASIQLLAMGMDLKGSELNSYHHWLLDAPLNNAKQRLAGIFDANNSNEAISWLFSLKNDAGNPAVMDAMTRAATYGAPIHNMPSFNNAFSNLLKSKLIDGGGILAPSTRYGTQSVLVPGRKLTNSTFYIKNNKRFQFDVGGARISAHNYNKTVNLKNLKIVRAKKNSPDTIEKVNVQKLAKELGIKIDWDNNTTLGEVWKALDTYNRSVKEGGDKLYVQLNGNRTPSTRPSDKLTLKLEGFKHSKEGNQLEINAYDLHLRAEGDFDVDKMNYWWDTPMSVANKWYNIAGQTGAAIGGTNKTSIKNPTFRDPQSLLEIASSREQAQKLRGRVGRIKNIINYLSHYSSGDGQVNRGLEINLGRLGGKIRVDKKKLHELWNGGDLEGGPLLHNFQEILDSKTGFDADKFSNVLNNILFGNKDRFNKSIRDGDPTNRYKGLFVLEEGKGIKQQGGRVLEKQWTKKSDFITDPIVQDIVLEVIKPYQRLLQLSTDVYEGGISRTPRWSDIMGMAREYNYSMESMYNNIYVKMKRKYKGNPTVDLIFKKNGNDKWITNNVLGTFNEAASLSGNKHSGKTFEQLLPFDRTLAELTAKDLMKAQGPRKLFGSRLIDFENWSKRFEGIDFQGDLSLKEPQSIMKEWVKDVRSDFRNMGYLNFLKYRVRNIQKMKNYAYEKGNNKLGASLDERWTRLQKQHDILAKQLKLSPKHMKTAQKYMLQELYKGLKNPRKFVKTYGKFLPKGIREDNVREWFSKNKILNGERTKIKNSEEMINRIIRKQGVIYEGVNTVEHLDNMIWHNILGHYAEVQIDMHSDFGKTYGVEFNKDITDFRRQWRKFQNARNTDRRKFKNKSLQIGGELITNDAQFANLMREVFDKKYQYWEEVGGLGNLFLTKVMTPEVNPMKLSYFGNKLGPSFFNSTADNMFIKFGINWVNNTELKSNMDKNQWFSHTMGNYRRLHDKFHGNGFDAKIFAKGTEEAGHLQFMERYQGGNKDMGILENFTKLEDILTDGWLMEKMGDTYGLPQNRTLRYLMTTQTTGVDFLAAMKESAYTSYFPQAFIEANYTGGPHPSISYGNAMKVVQGMNSALLGSNYKMSPLRLHDLPELPFNSTVNRSSKRDQSHKDADMQNFIKNKYNIECNQGGGL